MIFPVTDHFSRELTVSLPEFKLADDWCTLSIKCGEFVDQACASFVADNDDEDAENDQEDPDEEADPDDADEEDGDNLEAHPDSPQRHQVHEARPVRDQPQSHDRALKAADESNNEWNSREAKQT